MKKKILMLFVLAAVSLPSYAQRTAKGMQFVDATAAYTFSSLGGSVDWGMYFLNAYVTAGVNVAARTIRLSGDNMSFQLPYIQYTATGAYLYRFCGATSRWFTLNGGGGILLGAETVDPCGQAPEGVALSNAGTSFIYGVDVRLEMEFYVAKTFGFVVGGRLPMTFGGRCDWFHYEVNGGVRFNF